MQLRLLETRPSVLYQVRAGRIRLEELAEEGRRVEPRLRLHPRCAAAGGRPFLLGRGLRFVPRHIRPYAVGGAEKLGGRLFLYQLRPRQRPSITAKLETCSKIQKVLVHEAVPGFRSASYFLRILESRPTPAGNGYSPRNTYRQGAAVTGLLGGRKDPLVPARALPGCEPIVRSRSERPMVT